MQVDKEFYIFLRAAEGFRLCVYLDSGGVPTIGIGHKITLSERRSGKIIIDGMSVPYAGGLDHELALSLCKKDTKWAADCVNKAVTVPLTQIQFNVLVSFTFNVGTEAFKNSTLLKRVNAMLYDDVPGQLARWIFDDGKIVHGLIQRRNDEIALWESSVALV